MRLPSSKPARVSSGKARPAATLEAISCCAIRLTESASLGKNFEKMAEATPAATEYSQGKDGLSGLRPYTLMRGSAANGRGRLCAYLVAQAATVASYVATDISKYSNKT